MNGVGTAFTPGYRCCKDSVTPFKNPPRVSLLWDVERDSRFFTRTLEVQGRQAAHLTAESLEENYSDDKKGQLVDDVDWHGSNGPLGVIPPNAQPVV